MRVFRLFAKFFWIHLLLRPQHDFESTLILINLILIAMALMDMILMDMILIDNDF
jgi:hypothetical protein